MRQILFLAAVLTTTAFAQAQATYAVATIQLREATGTLMPVITTSMPSKRGELTARSRSSLVAVPR